MNSTISFQQSYLPDIGYALRQPLVEMTITVIETLNSPILLERLLNGQRVEKIQAIATITFRSLSVVMFCVPALACYLVGKLITNISPAKLNFDGLNISPRFITLPSNIDRRINLLDLVDQYDRLQEKPGEILREGQTSLHDSLRRMCDQVQTKHQTIYQDDPTRRDLFCTQVHLYLQETLKLLKNGKVSEELKRDVLLSLAEGSKRCFPTWLEVAENNYKKLTQKENDADQKILTILQNHKEQLILEFGQIKLNAHWHFLSFVRNLLGAELGLNIQNDGLDPYGEVTEESLFLKPIYRWLFIEKYDHVNHIIDAVKAGINAQAYDQGIMTFLKVSLEEVGKKTIEDPTQFMLDNFYDEDYKITSFGVHFMLQKLGIFRS